MYLKAYTNRSEIVLCVRGEVTYNSNFYLNFRSDKLVIPTSIVHESTLQRL
jgi:hypothetical protein